MLRQHRVSVGRKRIKGGFRMVVETELGEEQVCRSCGESWPTDEEFYVVTAISMAYECKACTSELRRVRRSATTDRTQVPTQPTKRETTL